MFETITENQAKKILSEGIAPRTKSILATCIFVAMQEAIKTCAKHPELPKSSRYDAGCQLRFNIDYLIAKVADEEPLTRITYSEISGNNSTEFVYDSRITIQVKKHSKYKELPDQSLNRKINSLKNQGNLFEDMITGYCIVTYNHKNFECSYIQIGVPDAEYTTWLATEPLMQYIDIALAEEITKTYSNDLQVVSDENIQKDFNLAISR